jgi:hypothetical protein
MRVTERPPCGSPQLCSPPQLPWPCGQRFPTCLTTFPHWSFLNLLHCTPSRHHAQHTHVALFGLF